MKAMFVGIDGIPQSIASDNIACELKDGKSTGLTSQGILERVKFRINGCIESICRWLHTEEKNLRAINRASVTLDDRTLKDIGLLRAQVTVAGVVPGYRIRD